MWTLRPHVLTIEDAHETPEMEVATWNEPVVSHSSAEPSVSAPDYAARL